MTVALVAKVGAEIVTMASHNGLRQKTVTPLDRIVVNQQIHAFSDASTQAYGAVIYLRTLYDDSSVTFQLVTSKARVAPVKSVTVPRLELMAAHLLSKLVVIVVKNLKLSLADVYAWTDSSIVLAWLRGSATKLKTFVANRVCTIQEQVPGSHWRHVRTEDNPADLASRGMSPKDVIKSVLWWKGPPWLSYRLLIGHPLYLMLLCPKSFLNSARTS